MDALAGLLEGPRARGAFMIRACFDPPWGVRVEDRAPLTVMLMVRGDAWILPGAECACPDGRPLNGSMDLGVRTRGGSLDGGTVVFIGTYLMRGEISGRLLEALPPLLTLTADVWECPLTPLLTAEIVRDEPGQEVVLDRLPDLLVIAALRAWFARPEAEAPGWYRAPADPVVGRVLRLLQDDPAHDLPDRLAGGPGGGRAVGHR